MEIKPRKSSRIVTRRSIRIVRRRATSSYEKSYGPETTKPRYDENQKEDKTEKIKSSSYEKRYRPRKTN